MKRAWSRLRDFALAGAAVPNAVNLCLIVAQALPVLSGDLSCLWALGRLLDGDGLRILSRIGIR